VESELKNENGCQEPSSATQLRLGFRVFGHIAQATAHADFCSRSSGAEAKLESWKRWGKL